MAITIEAIIKAAEENIEAFPDWYQKNRSRFFDEYLKLAFVSDEKWMLPEGIPDIKFMEYNATTLEAEFSRLKYFVTKGGVDQYPNLKAQKREQIFIDMLHGLPSHSREFLVAVKERKVTEKWPAITTSLLSSGY